MNNLKIYCLSLSDSHYKSIIDKDYIPVGLGTDNFKKGWLNDKGQKNISEKNPLYGEYTFHYNIWKNDLISENSKNWIGFCTYRRFWSQENNIKDNFNNINYKLYRTCNSYNIYKYQSFIDITSSYCIPLWGLNFNLSNLS